MYLKPGDQVGRYRVEALLEEGGVTAVYRVRHTELDSAHALQVLTTRAPAVRDGLRREWQVQARLRHPNIVSVTDLVSVDGLPAVVSELVEGPTLAEWLARTSVGMQAVDSIGRGLISGVQAAHANGLVHRDLRPSKVRLGAGLVPKIADFGLVSVVMASRPGLQRAGLPGTAGQAVYLAPEQIRDRAGIDERADVFGLGTVLYELACRRPAFFGHDRLDTFNRVSRGVFEPPRRTQPDLPERMERAILGALVPDPDSRIPNCATLAAVWAGTLVDWQSARLDSARRRAATELGPAPALGRIESPLQVAAPAGGSPTLVPEASFSSIPVPGAASPRQLAPAPARPRPAPVEIAAPPAFEAATPAPRPEPVELTASPEAALARPEPRTAPGDRRKAPSLDPSSANDSLPPIPSELAVPPQVVAGVAAVVVLGALFWWATQPAPIPVAEAPTPPPTEVVAEPVAAVVAPLPVVQEPIEPPPAEAAAVTPSPSAAPAPTTPPTPAPAPPPAPSAAPSVELAPDPVPEAPSEPSPWSTPTTASVTSDGGVRVWLVGSAGRFPVGEVPAGTYTIKAFFDPMQSTDAGTIRVYGGETWSLVCSKAMEVCSAKRP